MNLRKWSSDHRLKIFLQTQGIAIPVTILFLFLTRLIPAWGRWYSAELSYRFQDLAFLKGHLRISEAPFGHLFDWHWGNGLQTAWGLGVPLLRLPFEILARLAGQPFFPDRWIVLGTTWATVSLLTFRLLDCMKPYLSITSTQQVFFLILAALSCFCST